MDRNIYHLLLARLQLLLLVCSSKKVIMFGMEVHFCTSKHDTMLGNLYTILKLPEVINISCTERHSKQTERLLLKLKILLLMS